VNESTFLVCCTSKEGVKNDQYLEILEEKLIGQFEVGAEDFDQAPFMNLEQKGYKGIIGILHDYHDSMKLIQAARYLGINHLEKLEPNSLLSLVLLLSKAPGCEDLAKRAEKILIPLICEQEFEKIAPLILVSSYIPTLSTKYWSSISEALDKHISRIDENVTFDDSLVFLQALYFAKYKEKDLWLKLENHLIDKIDDLHIDRALEIFHCFCLVPKEVVELKILDKFLPLIKELSISGSFSRCFRALKIYSLYEKLPAPYFDKIIYRFSKEPEHLKETIDSKALSLPIFLTLLNDFELPKE